MCGIVGFKDTEHQDEVILEKNACENKTSWTRWTGKVF